MRGSERDTVGPQAAAWALWRQARLEVLARRATGR